MTTIRKIVTSQVDGNSANADNIDEIRPFGEASFYIDTSGPDDKLVLSMFDGQRTHLRSKVLSPGVLYGSNADSGDGSGFDTIKLIPDASLHYNDGNFSNDQYLVVDPTAPNHIHIRAGGTIDDSSAELFLGGEKNHVNVSDSNNSIIISTSDGEAGTNEWVFDVDGVLTLPIGGNIVDSSGNSILLNGARFVEVPTSSVGQSGDLQGDVAFNNSYMYYCKQDYVGLAWTTIPITNDMNYSDGITLRFRADVADPSNLDETLRLTNCVVNGVSVDSAPITSYVLVSGTTYDFFIDNFNQSNQGSLLQYSAAVLPDIWKRVAWSGDTW